MAEAYKTDDEDEKEPLDQDTDEEGGEEKSSSKLSAKDRADLIAQSVKEYNHALEYRQKREAAWLAVDELYYGKKKKSLVTRAQIHVPKMQGTIETFLSKIDDTPFISFDAPEEGDRPKVAKLNALLLRYRSNNDWDLVDLLGKKEGALYGRAIYKKYSANENGKFCDYFTLMSVRDFLIDPMAGGLFPMKQANYMGHDNIIRSRFELEDDVYDQEAVKRLCGNIDHDGAADNKFRSKENTRQALGLSDAVLYSQESVKLTEWYTTFKGVRYYVFFSVDFEEAVRIEPLEDVFASNEFPFATWSPFPRLDEFWTPGLGELIKEPNLVQNIVLSQILDNNAFRNYGMKIYDATKITNPAELKPRPMGKVAVNGNPRDAVMDIQFPSLDNAIATYNLVEGIFDKETGVTSAAKGMPNTKRMSATEFAGLLDQVADKFFTNNRLYKSCLRRIAELFYFGVEENMSKKERVRILGANGWEWFEIDGRDVKGSYDIMISSGTQEEQNKNLLRDRWADYISRNRQNPRLNQKFLDEKEAQVMGMDENEIQRLLNPDMESDWESLAEAAQENESMLSKEIEPNKQATTGHIEKHLQYLRRTNLKPEIQKRILAHAQSEIEFATRNESLKVNALIRKEMGAAALNVPEEAVDKVLNPPPSRKLTPPEGVDPEAYAAALQGQPPIPPAGIDPTAAENMSEAVRLEAIRNSPAALAGA